MSSSLGAMVRDLSALENDCNPGDTFVRRDPDGRTVCLDTDGVEYSFMPAGESRPIGMPVWFLVALGVGGAAAAGIYFVGGRKKRRRGKRRRR